MADATTEETRAEAEAPPESARFWLSELDAAGKRDEAWIKRARKVVARYRDERASGGGSGDKRANILWSNTEILKSATFNALGAPDVRRRFPKRGKDETVTKQAALVMERGAAYSNDAYDCEAQIEACVEDMLLPGRGQAWVIYDAVVAKDEETGEDEIRHQSVYEEHLYWEDYRTSAGREEKDIWWKARRHSYSRDDLREYFPDHADKIPLNAVVVGAADAQSSRNQEDTVRRGSVWQVWDKNKKQRIYVAEDYPLVLKREDDPYRLKNFFPCPPALYNGFQSTSTLEPVPEFTLYQDQADELDTISTRLYNLIGALKRRGIYDASSEDADNKLSQLAFAGDNEFVPYRGFAGLMEKGGLKQVFQTEDLAPLVTAIEGLYKRAAFLVNQIYETTGISDVIRGAQAAGETATEVHIKSQYGSMRLRKRQRQIQRFVRAITQIKAEIIAEHFSREQLQEMVGLDMPLAADKQAAMAQLQAAQSQGAMAQQMQAQAATGAASGQTGPGGPPPMGHNGGPPMGLGGPGMGQAMGMPQMRPPPSPEQLEELQKIAKAPSWEDIAAILRSDLRRGYKIDVETEDTAQADQMEEKQSRVEFMTTITALMEKAIPLAIQLPPMRPLVKESVMFLVKGFKAGRPLEESFEEAFEQIAKMPPPQQQEGDLVASAKAEQIKAQTQATIQSAQADAQTSTIDAAIKQQAAQADAQIKGLEIQGKQQELQTKAADSQADRAIKMREAQLSFGRKVEEAEMSKAMGEANMRLDMAERVQRMRAEGDKSMADMTHGDREHHMSMAERRQKMMLAEHQANRPQPTGA